MDNALMLDRLVKDASYNPVAKDHFHATGKRLLKLLAKRLTAGYGEYDVRSNMGGIAVSGEVTLHMDRVYIQISQSSMGPGRSIMFRSCDGRKDYRGGQNNFASIALLVDTENLARLIETRVAFMMPRGEPV